jgi:predicted nucleic acid-binding Zn ribbon protein
MSEARRKPERVAEALATYLERSGLGDRLEEMATVEDWEARVGDRIAAVAQPLHVDRGVLFVGVRSSAWLMELRMMEVEIRRRLNEGRAKGRIQAIRFVQRGQETGGGGRSEDGGGTPRGWRPGGR